MNAAHVQSFVLISILRGQPRTPPSGDNLGVLDYHLNFPNCVIIALVQRWCSPRVDVGFTYCVYIKLFIVYILNFSTYIYILICFLL